MFQLDFGQTKGNQSQTAIQSSGFDIAEIDFVSLSFWEEHCLECAQPNCYSNCKLFSERADKNCARFENGILDNHLYRGLFDFGAEIYFRPWGKLQTRFGNAVESVEKSRRYSWIDSIISRGLVAADILNQKVSDHRLLRLQRYYNRLRQTMHERRIEQAYKKTNAHYDAFLMEAWNLGNETFRLIFEAVYGEKVTFRDSFKMLPGRNVYSIPWNEIVTGNFSNPSRLIVHPEKDHKAHIVFTWLDAVCFGAQAQQKKIEEIPTKIKCVVWDLDDTVWEGVLGDDGPKNLKIRKNVLNAIQELDRRGILQSIASKNDYRNALSFLQKHSLAEYFLYKEINWAPKSESLQKIAHNLNIGLDTFAFIDDSAFEREEVKHNLSQVRTYAPTELESILEMPEFKATITEASKKRRLLYQTESKRKLKYNSFGSNYREFLLDCQLKMHASSDFKKASMIRCADLLQRTNQLNLSGRRLDLHGIQNLLKKPNTQCYWISCGDRYGDYGLVGFCAIRQEKKHDRITDLVLSCRIAQKKFENRFFRILKELSGKRGKLGLIADYTPTERNHVLLASLKEIGFEEQDSYEEENVQWFLSADKNIPDTDLVELTHSPKD
ncbi:HAD-IIIC family phosphatase [Verrucomicrobia bacterium]|nr:HAD-IIIC family phosphatase [Verrucomicrobiota bacterium]